MGSQWVALHPWDGWSLNSSIKGTSVLLEVCYNILPTCLNCHQAKLAQSQRKRVTPFHLFLRICCYGIFPTETYLFLCLNSEIPQCRRLSWNQRMLCLWIIQIKMYLLKFDAMAKWRKLSVHRVESFHLFCSASARSPPETVLFQIRTATSDLLHCADL